MELKAGERIDQLNRQAVKIIQSKDVFAFSLDAVLLADFAIVKRKSRVVDLAAGNGAVGLFVAPKTTQQVTLVEIQPRLADMAKRSIALNQFDHVDVLTMDLAQVNQVIPKDSVDVITCNPPYFKVLPHSQVNPNDHLAIARHELTTTFTAVALASASLLKYQGKAFFVHRPDRLPELLTTLTQHELFPKRLRFIHPKMGQEANMVLIEAIKAGHPNGVRILPPLFVHDETGEYGPEVRHILHG